MPLLVDGGQRVSEEFSGTGQNAPQPRKIYPQDDSWSDATFAAFKVKLLTAAEKGDLTTLRESLAPTVNFMFEPAPRDVVWKKLSLRSGIPWRALRDAVKLGVVHFGNGFVAPYVAARSDVVELTDFVVSGDNVRVRQNPHQNAPVIEHLSHDVVVPFAGHTFDPDLFANEDTPSGSAAWAHVTTPTGRTGYIYGKYLSSPAGLRFYFDKVDGSWKIVAIAEGD